MSINMFSTVKSMQPTSYKQIYKYIEQVCNECSIFIDTIEIDYYQGSSSTMIVTSPDQRTHRPLSVIIIQTWSQQLKQLQKVCYSKDIQNSTTARELIKEATLGSSVRFINNESIILMQRIDSKIREQLQFKIPILVEQISNCLKIMKQYCLSFYTIENIRRIIQKKQEEKLHDEDLETPYTYEKSRWLHIFQINQSLKILREMSQRIQHTEGVKLASLSKECQDLAYRCNCTTFPYIFVLSECYYQARQALNSLRTWLRDDMLYTQFVEKSLKLLDKKYLEVKQVLERSKTHLSQIQSQAKSQHIRLTKLEQENQLNKNKQTQSEGDFNSKQHDYSSKCITHQIYSIRLHKLLNQSTNTNDNNLMIEKFQTDIQDLANELPNLKSKVNVLRTRMYSFQEHERKLIEMRDINEKRNQEILLALQNRLENEQKLNRVVHCRNIIRNIYQCRKKTDLVQRIFYDLPIINHSHVKNEDDDLSKACSTISKLIGHDWNRFYWQLPFYPRRGQEELFEDLKRIDRKYQRGNIFQDQAMETLNKWRRFHTRARVDDLIHGLRQIHRVDIVQSIEQSISKPKCLLDDDDDDDDDEIDLQKKEIEDLNQKLIRLFEKLRNNTTTITEES